MFILNLKNKNQIQPYKFNAWKHYLFHNTNLNISFPLWHSNQFKKNYDYIKFYIENVEGKIKQNKSSIYYKNKINCFSIVKKSQFYHIATDAVETLCWKRKGTTKTNVFSDLFKNIFLVLQKKNFEIQKTCS